MSIFLEVLGQIDAKLKQMTEQVESTRWLANSGRFDAAYQHAMTLEDNLERATLLGRALPAYTGYPNAKWEVERIVQKVHPVEIGFTKNGWFTLRLPMLLPKKETGSTEFIRGFLYPAMQEFFNKNPPVRYTDCVLIFRHVYARDRPERRWRDHDNIEVNIVTDIVALYTLPDDNPTVCTHYYCSAAGNQERTEVYVVPKEDFPLWLDVEKNHPNGGGLDIYPQFSPCKPICKKG